MALAVVNLFMEFNDMHISALSEIGNIGSGHAATALSTMLSQPVSMSTPYVGIIHRNSAYKALGDPDSMMVSLLLSLKGEMSGMIMLLMPDNVACDLAGMLLGSDIGELSGIDEIGYSALMEVSNIMCASFVNAIAEMTGMSIDISTPTLITDKLRTTMKHPAVHFLFDKTGDLFLYIKNELEISGKRTPANVLLLPDLKSLNHLVSALGIS